MKLKTSELTDAALDWAVEWSQSLNDLLASKGAKSTYNPSTDWSQGGPIIEREGISLTSYLAEEDPYWIGSVECQYKNFNATAYYEEYGPTPLIAAMRCYVASKLGDEVDVPEELTKEANNVRCK